jgi:hypothetical protein
MNRSFEANEHKNFNSDWEKHQRKQRGGVAWIDWHFQNDVYDWENKQKNTAHGVAWVQPLDQAKN